MSMIELIPAVMAAGSDMDKKKKDQEKKAKVGIKKTLWDRVFSEACDRERNEDGEK